MFWNKKKDNYPSFYRIYLEKIHDLGFSDDILALDMETTSLNPKNAEVLSFGSVPIIKRKISPSAQKHIFFAVDIEDKTNMIIHEIISDKSLRHFREALPEILDTISNYKLLGHYVAFDIALINKALKQLALPKIKNPTIDTLQLALQKDKIHNLQYANKDNYTLINLADRFNIEVQTTHDALEDAYLCALVYLHLT